MKLFLFDTLALKTAIRWADKLSKHPNLHHLPVVCFLTWHDQVKYKSYLFRYFDPLILSSLSVLLFQLNFWRLWERMRRAVSPPWCSVTRRPPVTLWWNSWRRTIYPAQYLMPRSGHRYTVLSYIIVIVPW